MSPTTISRPKISMLILIIWLSIHTLHAHCKVTILHHKHHHEHIVGMFVFGSSLVDNGNNNYLANLGKVNHLPYGIDFIYGPSGRFTNGKNVIDLLCEKLHLPLIPVFADPTTRGSRIVHGVNFASGGSGILDDTGSASGQVFTLNQQIKNFVGVTLPELETQLILNSDKFLSKYLFVIGTAGNDLVAFFQRATSGKTNVTFEAFSSTLIELLSTQLKTLYSAGGRKFVLMSVYPLGCYPSAIAKLPNHEGCIETMNEAAREFNARLQSLVDTIELEMPGSNLVLVNTYKIVSDIIKSPASRGFNDTSNPCCEVSTTSNGVLCKRFGKTCEDRTRHVFFDGLHPTEAVNVQIVSKAFSSNLQSEVYPFNVKQLSKLM